GRVRGVEGGQPELAVVVVDVADPVVVVGAQRQDALGHEQGVGGAVPDVGEVHLARLGPVAGGGGDVVERAVVHRDGRAARGVVVLGVAPVDHVVAAPPLVVRRGPVLVDPLLVARAVV